MLVVFSRSGGAWKEVLRWESPSYDTVAGAFGSFDYAISPADTSGLWYVVAKNVSPWCTSTWQQIRYAVLRPVPGGSAPKGLFAGSDTIWIGNEDAGKLHVDTSEFDLRFHGASIDAGVHNRVYIRHYKVTGDAVARIQPVATSPRDFVDEWMSRPWEEASLWSSTADTANLRQMHEELRAFRKSSTSFFSYESALRCSDSPDRYEISLSYDESQQFYFQIRNRADFTMMAVSKSSDPACKGPNLLDSMDTQ